MDPQRVSLLRSALIDRLYVLPYTSTYSSLFALLLKRAKSNITLVLTCTYLLGGGHDQDIKVSNRFLIFGKTASVE